MMSAVTVLLTSADREDAQRLVEAQGLSFEGGCDDIVGIHDNGRLVATAARAGYVLKMFAVEEAYQSGDTLGLLATALTDLARRAGHDAVFVFTRGEHAGSFQACGFRLLVATGPVALLEHGDGLGAYLHGLRHLRRSAGAGAVIVNGNPFTRGHLYLVETAAAQVGTLFLFVVREDRSVFPFQARYRMARDATKHLSNVLMLDTSRYAISAATFPSYFLRANDDAARMQMDVDARLFGAHVGPALSIARRFVGHEPYCQTTATYNRVLAQVLPEYGVSLTEIQRTGDERGFVSATRVRAALATGDLETIASLVPKTTLAFLRSREGATIARKLRAGQDGEAKREAT